MSSNPDWTADEAKQWRATMRKVTGQRLDRTLLEADPLAYRAGVADRVFRLRGIDIDTWQCPCGLGYVVAQTVEDMKRESYPWEACRGCARPFPKRCLTPGCGAVVEPRERVTEGITVGREKHQARFTDTPDSCDVCASNKGHVDRAYSWSNNAQVPASERASAVKGFMGDASKKPVESAIRWWLDRNLGLAEGRHSLFVWGEPGRGKSTAAAIAAHRAFVDLGAVPSVAWTTQALLAQVFMARFRRDTERARSEADKAEATWQQVLEAPLLVLDDLFTAEPSKGYGEQLADLIRERLNARRPTVYTSNRAPDWDLYLASDAGRIKSRWEQWGVTVQLGGPDWRGLA